jgi:hypothetical protein
MSARHAEPAPVPAASRAPARSAGSAATTRVPPAAAMWRAQQSFTGTGRPVDPVLRTRMEQHLGHDLADVRIHEGPQVRVAATGLGAEAYTIGRKVALAPGPVSDRAALLAHELTHVVQQSDRRLPRGDRATAEREAHAGGAVGVGRPVEVACSLADWLTSTPDVTQYSPERLRTELCEVEIWLADQSQSGFDTDRVREARTVLTAEIARRAGATSTVARTAGPAGGAATVDPETAAILTQIRLEVAEIEALVVRYTAQVAVRPEAVALADVRGLATRLQRDEEVAATIATRPGAVAGPARAAAARFHALRTSFVGVLTTAERWHTAHDPGQSLGMWNEEQGTRLAGTALRRWDRAGWHRVVAAGAMIGAGGVALLDASEQLLSFGFHEAATAVSTAYARGERRGAHRAQRGMARAADCRSDAGSRRCHRTARRCRRAWGRAGTGSDLLRLGGWWSLRWSLRWSDDRRGPGHPVRAHDGAAGLVRQPCRPGDLEPGDPVRGVLGGGDPARHPAWRGRCRTSG